MRVVGVDDRRVAFDGEIRIDAIERSSLIVGPIDRNRVAPLAQTGQRRARRVGKPACRGDQVVDARAIIPLEQFDDLRQFGAAARSGRARGWALDRSCR